MENESVSDGEQDAKSKAEKEEENKKELALRTEQMNLVRAAIEKLDEAADEARKKNKRRKALLSHLRTFYSEMNNIAKGKAMSLIPVAELMVTQINDAIADAKKLIEGDVYLDRVKPFSASAAFSPARSFPPYQLRRELTRYRYEHFEYRSGIGL